MKRSKAKSIAASLVAASCLVTGCANSLKYRSRKAAPVASTQRLVVADIVDGRELGRASDMQLVPKKTREESLAQLRSAIRTHAVRSGLVSNAQQFTAAPSDAQALERAVAKARADGAQSLLVLRLDGLFADGQLSATHGIFIILNYFFLVGLAPSLIAFSIPLSGEYATATVDGFLVDPASGKVFSAFTKSFVLDDPKVTAWGHSPNGELKGVLFETMEQVFAEAQRQLKTADPSGGPQVPIGELLFSESEVSR